MEMSDTATKTRLGVGARLPRKEDARHLRGRGQFVADLRFPHTREVAFVRSPIAHGRIRSITIPPEAKGKVFTAADFPDLKPIRAVPDIAGFKPSVQPALATDKVRYVGQPIAMCVGATRAEAEDLAQSIVVAFDELPAVVDMMAALKPGAPLLHEEWGDNLFIEKSHEAGDIDSIRGQADVVVTREYRMNRQAGVSMEGRAALAFWDDRLDELVIYNSTQNPHQIRVGAAQFLPLDEHRVHVIAPDVGGGFGVKNVFYPEELAIAALGVKLRRPVRWVEDRREELLSALPARGHPHPHNPHAAKHAEIATNSI